MVNSLRFRTVLLLVLVLGGLAYGLEYSSGKVSDIEEKTVKIGGVSYFLSSNSNWDPPLGNHLSDGDEVEVSYIQATSDTREIFWIKKKP